MMILKILSLSVSVLFLISCTTPKSSLSAMPKAGMFKVAILYPGGDGKVFDMEYHEDQHMPMMAGLLGQNLISYEIDKGISGRTPTDVVPFVAIGYFYIHDVAAYNTVIVQNIPAIRADIEKYTNIQPTIQISEIRKWVQMDVK